MNILQQFEADQQAKLSAARATPDFGPGDTVRVMVKAWNAYSRCTARMSRKFRWCAVVRCVARSSITCVAAPANPRALRKSWA